MKRHKPSFGEVRPPHTQGINLLEQAMHQLDIEQTKYLKELPEQALVRLVQTEHCYTILVEALRRHLPKELRDAVPVPLTPIADAVDAFKRAGGYDVDDD